MNIFELIQNKIDKILYDEFNLIGSSYSISKNNNEFHIHINNIDKMVLVSLLREIPIIKSVTIKNDVIILQLEKQIWIDTFNSILNHDFQPKIQKKNITIDTSYSNNELYQRLTIDVLKYVGHSVNDYHMSDVILYITSKENVHHLYYNNYKNTLQFVKIEDCYMNMMVSAIISNMIYLIDNIKKQTPKNVLYYQTDFSMLNNTDMDLIYKLSEYPEVLKNTAIYLEPYVLIKYLHELYSLFASYINLGYKTEACKIITKNKSLTKTRLLILEAFSVIFDDIKKCVENHSQLVMM